MTNESNERIDPDEAPKLDRAWFTKADLRKGNKVIKRGRPRSENSKQPVSIRLDADVLAWFKQSGSGWQTRINDALRKVAGLEEQEEQEEQECNHNWRSSDSSLYDLKCTKCGEVE